MRYLLRRRGLTVEQCKQFSMMFRYKLVIAVRSDLDRVMELEERNFAMSMTDQKVIELVLQQLAHKACKEAKAGRLPEGALEEIDALGDGIVAVMGELASVELGH